MKVSEIFQHPGRKCIGMLYFSLLSTGLLLIGAINEQTWMTVNLAIFATFVAGNVAQKYRSLRGSKTVLDRTLESNNG